MKVWLYCICRNERLLMPYLLRHYDTFVDKMIFYDEQSNDGTREIIKAHPKCELRDWPQTGLSDDTFLHFMNKQWKEAKGQADWVAWIDADEFLYHPNMRQLLEHYMEHGVQVPIVEGYGMVSKAPPKGDGQIYDEIKTGFPSPEWSKPEIFHTSVNMVWNIGRHSLGNMEPYRSGPPDIKLLHYRYLGWEYLQQRCAKNVSNQPLRNRMLNHGTNNLPDATERYSLHWYKTQIEGKEFPNVI